MARTKARVGNGVTLSHQRVGAGSYTAVAEIVSVPAPETTTTDIKASHLTSDDFFHEYLPGMIEGGQLDCDFNYISSEIADLYDIQVDREVCDWKITVPDNVGSPGSATTVIFKGYINKLLPFEAQTDERMGGTLGIKVTGKPAFTEAT